MSDLGTLVRVVHAPPFGVLARDALRTALGRPDELAAAGASFAVTAVVDGDDETPLAEPLALVVANRGRGGRALIDGEVAAPVPGVRHRLAAADYRVRVAHPGFEPASLVLALPVPPPTTERRDAPPRGRDAYERLLAARRREVGLRPGAAYALPATDAPAARSLLVVAGRLAAPFDGTVELSRPQTPEPGGRADPGGAMAAHAGEARAALGRGFVLWTGLAANGGPGELELTLRPAAGRVRRFGYAVDLGVPDPAARATRVRPRRPQGRVQPPDLTLLML